MRAGDRAIAPTTWHWGGLVKTKDIARGALGPEKIQTDCTKLVKFDVLVNNEDDKSGDPGQAGVRVCAAAAQIRGSLKLSLKDVTIGGGSYGDSLLAFQQTASGPECNYAAYHAGGVIPIRFD
ncbi:hypothetical protein SASPL_106964 [Salvia splendens]|uniref:Uncharacterized protein n=1 Tax=Salvia splendens TaxID=180675 RepID=A0A8X8Y9J2_SALSN|nr:hypothetical protein SASPL_106964 [Salvia splendens]